MVPEFLRSRWTLAAGSSSSAGMIDIISYLKYVIFVEVEIVVVAMMIHLFEFESTIYGKYMVASLLIMKSVSYMYTCMAL